MRTSARWLVPVAVIAAVAGGVAINTAAAGSAPRLPARTPEQVLDQMAGSDVTALSGTVVTRADLGLPALPSSLGQRDGGSSGTDAQGLMTRFLTGENTLRVWADGPTRQRAELLDQFAELDVVRNGDQMWTYDSQHNTAQHQVLQARSGDRHESSSAAGGALTPGEMAHQALAAADPSTAVTLGDPELVAGRPAYTVTLTPRTSRTLVDHVVIAVDADRGVPLQVQVFARDTTQPVIETGFTAVDFATPAASTFTFTPPRGATVSASTPDPRNDTHPNSAKPIQIGSGWTSIVEVPASGASLQQGGGSGTANGSMLSRLGTAVPGGRAITTKLLSVLITDDGRTFAGAVPVQALLDAAR